MLFTVLALLYAVTASSGQDPLQDFCEDNNKCVGLRSCASLMILIQGSPKPLKPAVVRFLRNQECGFKDGYPMVCCPSYGSSSYKRKRPMQIVNYYGNSPQHQQYQQQEQQPSHLLYRPEGYDKSHRNDKQHPSTIIPMFYLSTNYPFQPRETTTKNPSKVYRDEINKNASSDLFQNFFDIFVRRDLAETGNFIVK